jgi:hypothetical protein
MSSTLDYKKILKAERKIGKKASRLVEDSIRKQIGKNFMPGNVNRREAEFSLSNSVNTVPVTGDVRLFRLSTSMAQHGFILQYGFSGKRSGYTGERKSGTFYEVKEHDFNLPSVPFIEDGIEKSGAFNVLFDELGALRMKEVGIFFKKQGIKLG